MPDRDKGSHMRTTPGGSASSLWGALCVISYTVNIRLGFQAALALTALWWLSEVCALSVYFKDCSILFASVQEDLLPRYAFSTFYDLPSFPLKTREKIIVSKSLTYASDLKLEWLGIYLFLIIWCSVLSQSTWCYASDSLTFISQVYEASSPYLLSPPPALLQLHLLVVMFLYTHSLI